MRYKLDTAHGRATLLDRRRVMAQGLDIVDAERIVEALNLFETSKTYAREYLWTEVGFDENGKFYTRKFTRLVPRYEETQNVP